MALKDSWHKSDRRKSHTQIPYRCHSIKSLIKRFHFPGIILHISKMGSWDYFLWEIKEYVTVEYTYDSFLLPTLRTSLLLNGPGSPPSASPPLGTHADPFSLCRRPSPRRQLLSHPSLSHILRWTMTYIEFLQFDQDSFFLTANASLRQWLLRYSTCL